MIFIQIAWNIFSPKDPCAGVCSSLILIIKTKKHAKTSVDDCSTRGVERKYSTKPPNGTESIRIQVTAWKKQCIAEFQSLGVLAEGESQQLGEEGTSTECWKDSVGCSWLACLITYLTKFTKYVILRMNLNGSHVFWMIIGENFVFVEYNKYIMVKIVDRVVIHRRRCYHKI